MTHSIHNALRLHMEADAIDYIKNGGDIEAIGASNQTPLHIASYEGFTKIVKLLIAKKANVNATDYKLWTPLHCAASSSFYDICEMLINAKANVICKTSENNTILHYLVKGKSNASKQVKIMAMVLSKGVLVNETNIHGETALMRACLVGSADSVYFLLSNGADVNIQNVLGETSLHQATRSRRMEIVTALIEKGANKSLKTTDGRTAYDEAMELGQSAIAKLLENNVANEPSNGISPNTPRMNFVAELSKQINQKAPTIRVNNVINASQPSNAPKTQVTTNSGNNYTFNRLASSVPNPKQNSNPSVTRPPVNNRPPSSNTIPPNSANNNNSNNSNIAINSGNNNANNGVNNVGNNGGNNNNNNNNNNVVRVGAPSPIAADAKFEALKREVIPLLDLINKDLAYIRLSQNGNAIVEKMQKINQLINVRPPVVARRPPSEIKSSSPSSPSPSYSSPPSPSPSLSHSPSPNAIPLIVDSSDNNNNNNNIDINNNNNIPQIITSPETSIKMNRPKSQYEVAPTTPTLTKQVSKDDLSVGLPRSMLVDTPQHTFATVRHNKLSATFELKTPRESLKLTNKKIVFSAAAYYKKLNLPKTRTMSSAPADPNMEKELIVRNKTLDEIFCTETQYVRQLGALKSFFVQALQNEPNLNLISDSQKSTIFINVEELFEVSFDLLKELMVQETLPPESQGIGSTFLSFRERMQIYRDYCTKQSGAMQGLQALRTENSKFDEFLNATKENEECGREDLEGFLIKPFQRICRYVLLLKELLKHTPKQWADYEKIVSAIEAIDSIVKEANEAKRVMDNLTKILEIQAAFDEIDLINSRQTLMFIDEGDFKEIDLKGHAQKRHFFLFNKYFIVAKALRGGKYEKCYSIPIENCLIWDKKDGDPSCKGFKNVFQLVTTQCSDIDNIKVMVSCPSAAQKDIWKNSIVEAISTGGLLY